MIKDLNKKILSDLTVHMKYAKYLPELNRRETWDELIRRNKNMHIKKYPELKDEINEIIIIKWVSKIEWNILLIEKKKCKMNIIKKRGI